MTCERWQCDAWQPRIKVVSPEVYLKSYIWTTKVKFSKRRNVVLAKILNFYFRKFVIGGKFDKSLIFITTSMLSNGWRNSDNSPFWNTPNKFLKEWCLLKRCNNEKLEYNALLLMQLLLTNLYKASSIAKEKSKVHVFFRFKLTASWKVCNMYI